MSQNYLEEIAVKLNETLIKSYAEFRDEPPRLIKKLFAAVGIYSSAYEEYKNKADIMNNEVDLLDLNDNIFPAEKRLLRAQIINLIDIIQTINEIFDSKNTTWLPKSYKLINDLDVAAKDRFEVVHARYDKFFPDAESQQGLRLKA